jgi:hypothetical protein
MLINLNVDLAGNVALLIVIFGGHANVVQALEINGGILEGCHLGWYAQRTRACTGKTVFM